MFDLIAFTIIRTFIAKGTLRISLADRPPVTLSGPAPGPQASIHVHDRRTLWRLVMIPDLAFGEAYMDGCLTVPADGLDSLVDLLMTNSESWARHWAGRTTLSIVNFLAVLGHWNPRKKSRRNVAHHYDLSDALFDTFLDPWRQYSCAYFHDPDESLDTAQVNKQAGDNILDIGCGWGGLGKAMAACGRNTRVTGITLSRHQLEYARTRAADSGFEDRVSYHLRDYRDQSSMFQKIVSVGMLEHVGPANFSSYFNKIKSLLADDGLAVIHTIGVHHHARPVNRWITKYIFPGGYLPSVAQMIRNTEERGLKLLDLEIMRGHYAETLRHWRLRFLAHRAEMTKLCDARFVRMWEFYLVGCEYFFRRQHGMVMQLQLAKDQMAAPMSRHHIWKREQEFKDRLWTLYPSGQQKPFPK